MLVRNNSTEEINNALLYLEKNIKILQEIVLRLKEKLEEK